MFNILFSEEDLRKCKEIAEKGFELQEYVRYPTEKEKQECMLELERKLSLIRKCGGNRVNSNYARDVFIGYYYVLENYYHRVTGLLLKDDLTNGKFNNLEEYSNKRKSIADLSDNDLKDIFTQKIHEEKQRLIDKGILT